MHAVWQQYTCSTVLHRAHLCPEVGGVLAPGHSERAPLRPAVQQYMERVKRVHCAGGIFPSWGPVS